jgi:putative peptidoglycan lipid II flippase
VSTDTSTEVPAPPTRRGASLVAAGIFLSRISGLIREIFVRGLLGLSVAGDAFAAALRIPNLLQNLLGEGVLSATFIPVYSKLVDEDRAEAGRVAGAVATLLFVVTATFTVAGVLLARPLTALIAVGLPDETFELTVDLVRITVVGMAFLVMSAWCLGVLNSHRHFFLPYVAPVVWNVVQIAVLAFVAIRHWTQVDVVEALAWSVVAGSVAQFLVQVPTVRRLQPGLRFGFGWRNPHVQEVVRRVGPAVLARGSVQLSAYIDLLLASFLAVGAVSALATAQVLYILPVSLFAMSIAAAELPELSRLDVGAAQAVRDRLGDALGRLWFYIGFVTVTYLAAGTVVVGALYQRGEFGSDDTAVVAMVLGAFAIALPAATTSRLLQNALYARGDVHTPASAAVVRLLVGTAASLLLMFQFDRLFFYDGTVTGFGAWFAPLTPVAETVRADADLPPRLGAVGLALGSAIAAWIELGLLWSHLRAQLATRRIAAGRLRALVPALALVTLVQVALQVVLDQAALPLVVDAVLVVGTSGLAYVLVCTRTIPAAAELVHSVTGAASRVLR